MTVNNIKKIPVIPQKIKLVNETFLILPLEILQERFKDIIPLYYKIDRFCIYGQRNLKIWLKHTCEGGKNE